MVVWSGEKALSAYMVAEDQIMTTTAKIMAFCAFCTGYYFVVMEEGQSEKKLTREKQKLVAQYVENVVYGPFCL